MFDGRPKSGAEEHLLGSVSPSWSPDGNHIAVDAGWEEHRIWVTDKNGHNPRQVTSTARTRCRT